LEGSRVDLTDSLRTNGRGALGAPRRRARALLVVSEVALGFVLLAGAGLLIRTFAAIERVDPGFRGEDLLTFELGIPARRYTTYARGVDLVRKVEAALRAIPGVASAGAVSHLPLDDYSNWYSPYAPAGAGEERKRGLMADHRSATPSYFGAVGATLVAG